MYFFRIILSQNQQFISIFVSAIYPVPHLQDEESGMFVDIIPEIDIPAHTLAYTQYRPGHSEA